MSKKGTSPNCCSQARREIVYDLETPTQGFWRLRSDEEETHLLFCPWCATALPATGWPEIEEVITLVFDVDGVICQQTTADNYEKAVPYPHAIETINSLYNTSDEHGNRHYYIRLQTARYMNVCDGNQREAARAGRAELRKWLKTHEVLYDELYFGKASGMLYVDDRAVRVESSKGMDDWLKNFYPALQRLEAKFAQL